MGTTTTTTEKDGMGLPTRAAATAGAAVMTPPDAAREFHSLRVRLRYQGVSRRTLLRVQRVLYRGLLPAAGLLWLATRFL